MEKIPASSVTDMSTVMGVQALVRRTHEDRVLEVLRQQGALTRGELSARIGLSRTTLSDIAASLLSRGVISSVGPQGPAQGRGRPAERLRLDPTAGHYLGVDFRHTTVCVAVANAARELIASDTTAYDADADGDSRITAALHLIDRMSIAAGIHLDDARGVAVGLPGPLRYRTAGSPDSAVGPQPSAESVRARLAERFAADILIDNNTRLAALAEAAWDSSGGVENLLYLRVSSGIGGGLVIGGRLVSGAAGLAGEFGHVTVAGADTSCRCGKRGCLETVASVDAILTRCREAGVQAQSLDDLRAAVVRDDERVRTVLQDAGTAIGRVLGALALSLNPSEIVIGGEVAGLSDDVLEHASQAIADELRPVGAEGHDGPRIRRSRLREDGGAIGGIVALLRRTPLLRSYPPHLTGEART